VKADKTTWKPVPLAIDDALKREVESVAKALNQKQAWVMREAMRKGLEIVQGGKVVRLSAELAHFVASNAERFKRTEQSILAEAVERGIKAVELHALVEQAKKEGTMSEQAADAMLAQSGPNAYPEKRAVQEAVRERGNLAIQLDDLLSHCPEARERKALIEQHEYLMRKRYGTGPSMWGTGVGTDQLKKNIAVMEAEIAKGARPSPETLSMHEQVKAFSESIPIYPRTSIGTLPVTVKPVAPNSAKPSKRAKKKPGQ
jgi:predicted transcriptional regulator